MNTSTTSATKGVTGGGYGSYYYQPTYQGSNNIGPRPGSSQLNSSFTKQTQGTSIVGRK